jgi:hypothetical protein
MEGVRDPEDFLRAPLSVTAAREHGSERRRRMFRISRIAAGSGSRQAGRMRKRSLSVRINGRIARGTSKLGLVVPTGFEPVFKDDYDFALYFREFR